MKDLKRYGTWVYTRSSLGKKAGILLKRGRELLAAELVPGNRSDRNKVVLEPLFNRYVLCKDTEAEKMEHKKSMVL